MTAQAVAVDALLAAGVAAAWVCALGVLVMRGPYDKLHYAGAGATLPAVLICAAVMVHFGWSASGLQTIAVLLLVAVPAPATTMALARAARRIDEGNVRS